MTFAWQRCSNHMFESENNGIFGYAIFGKKELNFLDVLNNGTWNHDVIKSWSINCWTLKSFNSPKWVFSRMFRAISQFERLDYSNEKKADKKIFIALKKWLMNSFANKKWWKLFLEIIPLIQAEFKMSNFKLKCVWWMHKILAPQAKIYWIW